MEQIREPIFIVGSGRSGSSIFAHLVSFHSDVAFLTSRSVRYPDAPEKNQWVMRALDVPGLRRLVQRAYSLAEAYEFWETHAPGFSEPMRDLRSSDVTVVARNRLRAAVAANLTSGRDRFLAKITGWGRVGYLSEVFPNARFIHLVRDGRDVANSLLKVGFWQGWRGPENWRFGTLPPDLRQKWKEHDRSFVALAGLCWRLLVDSVESAREEVPPDRFWEIRYEDFVDEPRAILEDTLDSANLAVRESYFRRIQRQEIRDASGKYRRDLTRRQQKILEDVTRPSLERYGYP